MNSLNAISPIDGRYRNKVDELASYFSEGALIRYRVRVEIEYFIALGDLPQLPVAALFQRQPGMAEQLRDIYRHFTEQDALEVKEIEKTTNHDVKAVEYFIKRRFDTLGLEPYKEFIHFGLTSQDINNTSVPLLLKECHEQVLLPRYQAVLAAIEERARQWADIPMLAHTHGQPASPTSLGKELMVFAYRMRRQMDYFGQIPFNAKFGGSQEVFDTVVNKETFLRLLPGDRQGSLIDLPVRLAAFHIPADDLVTEESVQSVVLGDICAPLRNIIGKQHKIVQGSIFFGKGQKPFIQRQAMIDIVDHMEAGIIETKPGQEFIRGQFTV